MLNVLAMVRPRVTEDRITSVDEDDVDAVLRGETHRFEGIVRRWQTPLVNLAYRFVRDPARAEEFAQEAFLKCYRSLAQWRRDAQFSTWLFSVALSVYRSNLRRLEPLRDALGEAELLSTLESTVGGEKLDEQIAILQRDRRIRDAVADLPPLFRDPLLVYYFQEEDLAASAKILGLREGTLKARLHRAREALRATLEKLR